jgi:hypothetical protein
LMCSRAVEVEAQKLVLHQPHLLIHASFGLEREPRDGDGNLRGGPGGGGEAPNLLPIIRLVLAAKLSRLLPDPPSWFHLATAPKKPSPDAEDADVGELDESSELPGNGSRSAPESGSITFRTIAAHQIRVYPFSPPACRCRHFGLDETAVQRRINCQREPPIERSRRPQGCPRAPRLGSISRWCGGIIDAAT